MFVPPRFLPCRAWVSDQPVIQGLGNRVLSVIEVLFKDTLRPWAAHVMGRPENCKTYSQFLRTKWFILDRLKPRPVGVSSMQKKPSGEVLENTSPDINDDQMCGGQTTIVIVQYSAPLLQYGTGTGTALGKEFKRIFPSKNFK